MAHSILISPDWQVLWFFSKGLQSLQARAGEISLLLPCPQHQSEELEEATESFCVGETCYDVHSYLFPSVQEVIDEVGSTVCNKGFYSFFSSTVWLSKVPSEALEG